MSTERITCNTLILGGGPGGYVAAIRCGQLGIDTVLVEAVDLGGVCLNRGCIPSKALIHAAEQFDVMVNASQASLHGITLNAAPSFDMAGATQWKDNIVSRLNTGVAGLLKKSGVRVVRGWGTFSDAKTCEVETPKGRARIEAQNVILATGSRPAELPSLPYGGKVVSSTEALALDDIPSTMVVVGGGYIGLELGSAYAKLGASVTVVEAEGQLLPQYDAKLVQPVQKALKQKDVRVLLKTRAIESTSDGLLVEARDGSRETLPAEIILVTVGRKPYTDGWGLENMALTMDGPFVAVDEQCRTASKNVWAIGDLVGEPMLAHKASAQGEMVAEVIAGKRRRFVPEAIPAVCFTDPEIVSVGVGPDHDNVEVGVFPLAANGRYLSMDAGDDGGFIRVISDKATHRILGVQAVGKGVSELSSTFVMAIESGLVLEDVSDIVFAHPTVGEAFHEGALKTLGHAIHI